MRTVQLIWLITDWDFTHLCVYSILNAIIQWHFITYTDFKNLIYNPNYTPLPPPIATKEFPGPSPLKADSFSLAPNNQPLF